MSPRNATSATPGLGHEEAIAHNLAGLRALMSERRRALGLSQLDVDAIAGLQPGYTGKLETGAKGYGPASLAATLKALGVGIAVVPALREDGG